MGRISFSAMWSDKLGKEITLRAKDQCPDGYDIKFGHDQEAFEAVREAVNQGIDAHLEAVMFTQNGNNFVFESDTLHVLVRRLMESGAEEAESFASAICETLGIELI